jgi:hypothetical protein
MEINIKRKRGDTNPDVFLVSKSRVATNLTGCTFKLTLNTLRSPLDATTQVYQIDGIVADPTTGLVSFTPTLSQADHVGYFFYDVQMIDSYAVVQTLVEGSYTYSQDITK